MDVPLFPLNSVLFPGATLPLHIFEARYKEMIRRCLEENIPFGVTLIRKGSEVGEPAEPSEVGTLAHITQVRYLDEGRMNLICRGGQRFRLLKTLHQTPYIMGEVETLLSVSPDDAKALELSDTASALFGEYYRLHLALSNQWARVLSMPRGPDELADFIGCHLEIGLWSKQRLLEELSTPRRLEMEIEILASAVREMTPRVEEARSARWRDLGTIN